jgi:predicted component of type VI protein secretion system
MSTAIRSRRGGVLVAAAVGLVLASGCSSTASLQFRCFAPINGGLLLTVDVVRATEEQSKQIQTLGERWFYDPMRETMRDRTTTVTFPTKDAAGDCVRQIQVTASGKEKFLVIVADYKYQSPDLSKQIVSLPQDRWKGKTLSISVRDRELSVETK